MKLYILALTALAVAVVASEDDENNAVRAQVADKVSSLASLLETETETEAEAGTDVEAGRRRRRRWHGHWPHGHRPHHHWPHGHRPHIHIPHIHVPVKKWAKDAIRGIADGLAVFGKWLKDILDSFVDFVNDTGKAIIKAMELALKAIGKAIGKATSAIKNVCTKAIDGARNVVKNYIKPALDAIKSKLKQINVNVIKEEHDFTYISGFSLNMWLCPSSKTKTKTLFKIPTVVICIPTSVTNLIKKGLAWMYNLVSGRNVHWSRVDISCHYNFVLTVGVSGEVGAQVGVGVTFGGSVSAGFGIGFGCDGGAWMAAILWSSGVSFSLSFGISIPSSDVGKSFDVAFSPGPPDVPAGGWGSLGGFGLGFSVGVGGGLFGMEVSGSIGIATTMPTFDFGCNAKDYCAGHKSFGACPVCATTAWFCGVINWLPWVRCNGREICAKQVPTGMYCHGCSWDFVGVGIGVSFAATTEWVELTLSFGISVGMDSVPLQLKIATNADNDC